ncbi:MAG: hypothetical protein JO136_15860 [Hyphomicrobiales bacterium]|jgi:hypothetical protein|nr:hypothetical protein [Hyphomicrobiales bacterium]
MNRPFLLALLGLMSLAFCPGPSVAQLALPGATSPAPEGAAASPKPKSAHKASSGGKASDAKPGKPAAEAGVASLVGRPLMLNGKSGLLQISGDDTAITVDKLQLAGEGVSDSSQRCVVDIVGETPIQATNVGRPDGLERFEVKVPACPISFDVLDGAVLVPTQITACVFKAADCQTTPGGLWGPEGGSVVGDAAKIVKDRAEAEKSMGKLVREIEDRAEDNAQAADLVRDQNGFAAQRDELCRDYAKESLHGYCALRVTEARTALLQARLNELSPATASKTANEKSKKAKSKKSAKQP